MGGHDVTLAEIISLTGYLKASVHQWMAHEDFPKPHNAPFRPRRWKREVVEKWLQENALSDE